MVFIRKGVTSDSVFDAHDLFLFVQVILDCTVDNSSFYEKCGFKKKEIQMAAYFWKLQ